VFQPILQVVPRRFVFNLELELSPRHQIGKTAWVWGGTASSERFRSGRAWRVLYNQGRPAGDIPWHHPCRCWECRPQRFDPVTL